MNIPAMYTILRRTSPKNIKLSTLKEVEENLKPEKFIVKTLLIALISYGLGLLLLLLVILFK